MSNEFGDFIALLIRIVRFVLDQTVNALCFALLVVGLALPWRWPFVVISAGNFGAFRNQDKFREWALCQFGCSLVDAIAVPLGILSLLWPLRWLYLAKGPCKNGSSDTRNKLQWDSRIREDMLCNLWESVLDLLLLPMVLVALVLPWRTSSTVPLLREINETDFYKHLGEVRNVGALQGLNAIVDAPFFAWALLSVFVPSRTWVFCKNSFSPRGQRSCQMRWFWCCAPILALVDIFCFVLAIFAVLNPFRVVRFVRCLVADCNSGPQHVRQLRDHQVDWDWNSQLRFDCLKYGLHSIVDLVVLPFATIVFGTVYRAKPLWNATWSATQAEAGQGYMAAAGQACAGMFNFQEPESNEHHSEERELKMSVFQRMALRQFGLLILDLGTLPALLLVTISFYRLQSFRAEVAEEAGVLSYHKAVSKNAAFVLHDCVLAVLCIPLILSWYRAKKTVQLIREAQPGFRRQLWWEVLALVLDLPLLPLLLILLVSLWRADLIIADLREVDGDMQRRGVILSQFLRLLRDIASFVVACVLLVTMVRFPQFVLDLWAQRGRIIQGRPRLRLRRACVCFPRSDAQDRRPLLVLEGGQSNEMLDADRLDHVQLNVFSKPFWDAITRAFGSAVASIGRGVLPLTLIDGKHFDFNELFSPDFHIELRVGSRTLRHRLNQLDPSVHMCLQLEHRSKDGSEGVLMRLLLPLNLLRDAAEQEGTNIEVPPALLEEDAWEAFDCGPLEAGAGIREGLWICASLQLWQLLLDLLHVLIFVMCMIAPWRLASCIYFVVAPESKWVHYVAARALRILTVRGSGLRKFSKQLQPILNCTAKEHANEVAGGMLNKLEEVAKKLFKDQIVPPQSLHKSLLAELKGHSPDLVKRFERHAALQDAMAAYWPSLTFTAHSHLTTGRLNANEHTQVLHIIDTALQQASADLEASELQLHADIEDMKHLKGGGCSLSKATCTKRHMVRMFALRALTDWGVFALFVLLFGSIYRLPEVLVNLFCDGPVTFDRLRMVAVHHVSLLARDLWRLASALLMSMMALVTLVHAVEFLEDALTHCRSLLELRACACKHTGAALSAIWELFTLFFLWKTYRALVRGAVFALLLPASGFHGPHMLRIVLWFVLCALPWVIPKPTLALGIAVLVALPFFIRTLKTSSLPEFDVDNDTWQSPTARCSSPNFIALVGIYTEAAFLVGLPAWPMFFNIMRSSEVVSLSLVITVLWLLVCALPFAIPENDRDSYQRSARHHITLQLLRQFFLIPAIAALLVFVQDQGTTFEGRATVMLLVFLCTTAVLGINQMQRSGLPMSAALDITYSPFFLAGQAYAQLTLLAAKLLGWPLEVQIVVAAAGFFWAAAYSKLFGPCSCVPWVTALTTGAAAAPLWSSVQLLVEVPEGGELLGYCIIVSASMLYGAVLRGKHAKARQQAAVNDGVLNVFSALEQKSKILFDAGECQSATSFKNNKCRSACTLAMDLQDFEILIPFERLQFKFLRRRKEWLCELHAGRNSFEAVAKAARELLSAVQTPPHSNLVIAEMKSICPSAKKVPTVIWQLIMEGVCDCKMLVSLMAGPAHAFRDGDVVQQIQRAWSNMAWCLDTKTRIEARLSCSAGDVITADNVFVGLAVQKCDDWDDEILAAQTPGAVVVPHGTVGVVTETDVAMLPRTANRRRFLKRNRYSNSNCMVQWDGLQSTLGNPLVSCCQLNEASSHEVEGGKRYLLKAHEDRLILNASGEIGKAVALWEKEEAPKVYGKGCQCGRSLKPTIYFECNFSRRITWPCCPERFTQCCSECPAGHSRSCEARNRQMRQFEVFTLGGSSLPRPPCDVAHNVAHTEP